MNTWLSYKTVWFETENGSESGLAVPERNAVFPEASNCGADVIITQ